MRSPAHGNPGRSHQLPGRTNELQAMLRWRGNIAGVGIAASVGMMSSQVIRNVDIAGDIAQEHAEPAGLPGRPAGQLRRLHPRRQLHVGQRPRFFYIPINRGAKGDGAVVPRRLLHLRPGHRRCERLLGQLQPDGGRRARWRTASPTSARPLAATQSRYAFSLGANYRLAPGMDLVAEWTQHTTHIAGQPQPAGLRDLRANERNTAPTAPPRRSSSSASASPSDRRHGIRSGKGRRGNPPPFLVGARRPSELCASTPPAAA